MLIKHTYHMAKLNFHHAQIQVTIFTTHFVSLAYITNIIIIPHTHYHVLI